VQNARQGHVSDQPGFVDCKLGLTWLTFSLSLARKRLKEAYLKGVVSLRRRILQERTISVFPIAVH
jgi:hypothetical protein